ncbi:MAG: c-type cytochrome [Burkholderiales bacterium]
MKLALFAAALLLGAGPALAQDASALRARSLAATCAQCHGTDGRAPPGSAVIALAGMPAPYLVEQMKAFKGGVRPGTVMPQLAKGYSDAQIEQLGAYFAQLASMAKP